jgi:hypothetical protein
MKWIDIEKSLPESIPDWYLDTHCSFKDSTSALIFGYDAMNFAPRYEVVFVNDLANIKPDSNGKYVMNKLIVTHWLHLERP